MSRFYSSKLLLFGEYTIIKGSKALAMPLANFGGCWAFDETVGVNPESKKSLAHLLQYLQDHNGNGQAGYDLSLADFKIDIEKGLYFDSNIPMGYGLGSSGALTAAVFGRYYRGEPLTDLIVLKQKLAQIEACFHGESSGIDPLICWINKAVLMQSKANLQEVKLPEWQKETGAIFLLNTQMPRQTAPLVQIFKERCKDEYYDLRCQTELGPLNDDAIHAFLQSNWTLLYECIHEIGHFQFRYFDAMIPAEFRTLWLDGLSSDLYKLKLCGAGGGGFILGFTPNWSKTKEVLTKYELLRLF